MNLANTGPIKGIHSNGICCHTTRIGQVSQIFKIYNALKSSRGDLLYIVTGCLVFIIGMKALMIPHQLLGGGIAGIVLLFHYIDPGVDLGLLYLLMNVPLIWLGWHRFGERFLVLTIFGMIFFSVATQWVEIPEIIFHNRLIATLFAGVICGLGSGLILRSRGSAGGFDILAIALNRKTGLSLANISLALNALPLIMALWINDLNTVCYSCLFHFACSRAVKVVLGHQ